ncbi:ABC transporter permease [Streptomyces sp. SJ1-7]|nr:ABC transporter permease [Streptomyces sp. SJ1-7]
MGRLATAGGHIARWTVDTLGVLLAMSVGTFALVLLARGDPAAVLAATRAGRPATPEQIEAVRGELGLDDPAPVRYVRWLADACTGDFGRSLRTDAAIGPEVADRLGVTLALVGGSALIAVVFGWASVSPGRYSDAECCAGCCAPAGSWPARSLRSG